MADYQGMRWFKCDLQVQTPEDSRHWEDADTRLSDQRRPIRDGLPNEHDIQEKARCFLRRCHALELDVIGVTDHNFSSKVDPRDWFLTHLVEQNKAVAREVNRAPLVILPGFEVDIGYHMLCLFKPAKKVRDLRRVNAILNTLGLTEHERFVRGVPQPLRFNDQDVSIKTLLEVVQDERHGIGIAAHADQEDGILSHARFSRDYSFAKLLCVELTQNPPAQRYADILEGRHPEWARTTRQPAWIMSSDAKSLAVGEDGLPKANALGYRYTWLKMSQPSIEALRQAFLDHESRIRRPEAIVQDLCPSALERHPRIVSVRIEGAAFADDQTIAFSSNLNCLIGGRGSGKSTVLEYLRLAFGKDQGLDGTSDMAMKVERVRDTLQGAGAEIAVVYRNQAGVEDEFRFSASTGARLVGRTDVVRADAVMAQLPVTFLSQQELSRRTEGRQNLLLPLLDAYDREGLRALETRERELRSEIERLFGVRRQKSVLDDEEQKLAQEVTELDRGWSARASLQAASEIVRNSHEAQRYVEQLLERPDEVQQIMDLAQDIADGHSPLGSAAESWPESEWFIDLDSKVEAAKQGFTQAVINAVNDYEQAIASALDKDQRWTAISHELASAQAAFVSACEAQGLRPEEVAQLQDIDRKRKAKQIELERKRAQIASLRKEADLIGQRMDELHALWRQQYDARCAAAGLANRIGVNARQKFIEVTVGYAADPEGFAAAWERLAPDRRTQLGRSWTDAGRALLDAFNESAAPSPWSLLESYFPAGVYPPESLAFWVGDMEAHLRKEQIARTWEQVLVTRVPDLVDLVLYRTGNERAGSVREGKLSDGQRNTAALALILAQGDGPLVIDQPEDELDSQFIYRDLVPLLREIKEHRQLIFATHNANLPVNADAELIYALEAREGRGRCLAQGGLDRPDVTAAVLDIMEGSEEAFRRRGEKYHF